MKKILYIFLSLLVAFSCVFVISGCGKTEYSLADVIEVRDGQNEIIPLEVLTGNELSTDYTGFHLVTKKAIRITSFSYTNDRNQAKNQVNDSWLAELCKEYQAGEEILSYGFMVYNLVIEFEVIE